MFYPEGVYVAMLTPFDRNGGINEKEMRRMVDFNIECGVDGLFPVSTVGEFIHLSPNEKVRLMEVVAFQAGGRVRVTPGVGSTNPWHSIELALKAKELGCDGVVVAPPYFFPLSQDMVEKYFEEIVDAVDLPVILYNIPLFTQPLSYEVVQRLCGRSNVVGMKDSSGSMVDMMHFMDVARQAGAEMAFLTGREETLLACLMMGARGCMAATPGILPEIMVCIYEAWKRGDLEKAGALQRSILPLVRAMFSVPFPLGFKAALEVRGFRMGPPKQALPEGSRSRVAGLKRKLKRMITNILDDFEVYSR
jgi:dihydrodipicolinate synthase/N-acetylneuraminate lyase